MEHLLSFMIYRCSMDINTYLANFTGDKYKVKQFIKRSIALLKFNGQMVDDSFANDLFQWVNKNRSKETLKAFEYFQNYYAEINQSLGQSEGESILVDTPEEIARDKEIKRLLDKAKAIRLKIRGN